MNLSSFLYTSFRNLKLDIDARAKDGRTALMIAAAGGHAMITEALLGAGADPNARQPDLGFNPLHYAARFNQLMVCRILIAKGANADSGDANGMTPSWWARELGHGEDLLASLEELLPVPSRLSSRRSLLTSAASTGPMASR